jgi:Flp pilus assembly protein TadB
LERKKSRSAKKEREKSRSAGAQKREHKSAKFKAQKRARKRQREELRPRAQKRKREAYKKARAQLCISGWDTAAGSVKNPSHLAVLVLLLTSSVHADIWTLVSVYKLEKDTVKDERSLHVVYILENIPPPLAEGGTSVDDLLL